MGRRSGRNGRVYWASTSGSEASPLGDVSEWSLSLSQDQLETSALGDATKVYVAGLTDANGSFSGFWNDTTATALTAAATDGVARKLYCYPDITNAATKYWYTTAIVTSYEGSAGVAAAVAENVNWSPATPVVIKYA